MATISELNAINDNYKLAEEHRSEKMRRQLEETRVELAGTEGALKEMKDHCDTIKIAYTSAM